MKKFWVIIAASPSLHVLHEDFSKKSVSALRSVKICAWAMSRLMEMGAFQAMFFSLTSSQRSSNLRRLSRAMVIKFSLRLLFWWTRQKAWLRNWCTCRSGFLLLRSYLEVMKKSCSVFCHLKDRPSNSPTGFMIEDRRSCGKPCWAWTLYGRRFVLSYRKP